MEGYFFKRRKSFDLKPNKYDLGITFWQTSSHLDIHFLNKIVKIDISEYPDLYDYHKTYYLTTNPQAEEKVFFENLYNLVQKAKSNELQKDPIGMNPRQKNKSEKYIKDYKNFTEMMNSKDNWNITSSEKEEIKNISKNLERDHEYKVALRNENEYLKEQLLKKEIDCEELKRKLRAVTVAQKKKIKIKKENFGTLLNLILALKELKLPIFLKNEDKLSQTFFETPDKSASTWYKLVTNSFSLEGEEIELSRVENYFRPNANRGLPRSTHQCKIEILTKKAL